MAPAPQTATVSDSSKTSCRWWSITSARIRIRTCTTSSGATFPNSPIDTAAWRAPRSARFRRSPSGLPKCSIHSHGWPGTVTAASSRSSWRAVQRRSRSTIWRCANSSRTPHGCWCASAPSARHSPIAARYWLDCEENVMRLAPSQRSAQYSVFV